MSSSSEPATMTATTARSFLPPLTFTAAETYINRRGEYSPLEHAALYTHYLVARGDFHAIVDFLDALAPSERQNIVNHVMYDTWWGNTLHTCLYWNTGHNALNIYRYLVGCGATPVKDYYEQYPWEMDGSQYVCPLRGHNVCMGIERDSAEFASTHADVLRFFGPAAGAGAEPIPPMPSHRPTFHAEPSVDGERSAAADALRAECALHRPGSIYTRNSNGLYGSFTPSCNGCYVGAQEQIEHTVADRISANTYRLRVLWSMRYDDESVVEARGLAASLEADIAELEHLTEEITTPIQYARRALNGHNAAMTLHNALSLDAGPVMPSYTYLLESIRQGELGLEASHAPILQSVPGIVG
jgi:hypothetical protein